MARQGSRLRAGPRDDRPSGDGAREPDGVWRDPRVSIVYGSRTGACSCSARWSRRPVGTRSHLVRGVVRLPAVPRGKRGRHVGPNRFREATMASPGQSGSAGRAGGRGRHVSRERAGAETKECRGSGARACTVCERSMFRRACQSVVSRFCRSWVVRYDARRVPGRGPLDRSSDARRHQVRHAIARRPNGEGYTGVGGHSGSCLGDVYVACSRKRHREGCFSRDATRGCLTPGTALCEHSCSGVVVVSVRVDSRGFSIRRRAPSASQAVENSVVVASCACDSARIRRSAGRWRLDQ